MAAKNLTTLVKALEAAGLVETLKGAGPFTVFAPDDKAFSKLPTGALDALLAENQALRNHNALLQDDIARLGRNVEKLSTWGDGLYAELVKIKGR